MRKRIVSLVLLSSIALSGCVSRAEYNELESRISALESKTGFNVQTQSEDKTNEQSETNGETSLSEYVENWDEVVEIIKQVLGKTDITISRITCLSGSSLNSDDTFKTFGNATLFVTADGIDFQVETTEYVAQRVTYNNGKEWVYIDTPSKNSN